jgi:putative phage-type endonuclease
MPRLTDEQLAERALGLGATDVVTAAGLNPYQTPFELYLSKIGELDVDATISDSSRGRMERGHRLEDVALAWDRDERGGDYERVSRTVWHPRIPFIYCHPDARRKPWRTTRRLIEVKTSLGRWNEVPRRVEAQVQVQMACTSAVAVDVLVLGFDGPPARLEVVRDDALIGALEQVAIAMWDRIERRDPPPVDGGRDAGRWLDRTRWADEPDLMADRVQRALLSEIVDVRRQIDALSARDAVLVNDIKFSMAGSGRLNAPGVARAIWTKPGTYRDVKWKDVAAELRIEAQMMASALKLDVDLDAIEQKYTSERESRSFRVLIDDEGSAT